MIKKADDLKYIIATSVSSNKIDGKDKLDMAEVGLVDAHAYSLISADEITDRGQKVRLLKIRNPWGFKEWNGDWGDKSDKWTDETKRQVDFVDANDGTFFISFEDYVDFFYITTICKYVKGSDISEIAGTHEKGGFLAVEFHNPIDYNETHIDFSAHQIHSRFMDETMRGTYRYAPIKLILAKIVKT